MNKSNPVRNLKFILCGIAIIGYGFFTTTALITIFSGENSKNSICFDASCVEQFTKEISGSLAIAGATSELLVTIATVGGIVVALMSYVSGVNNSAFSNHLTHYSTFQSYVISEISKRDRISPSSIDIFSWYNMIFPRSKLGEMTVEQSYIDFTDKLNNNIRLSNDQISLSTEETFRYKPHQERIKETLSEIGIDVTSQPRVQFFEIEDQIFSLISCINQAFCTKGKIGNLVKRNYY